MHGSLAPPCGWNKYDKYCCQREVMWKKQQLKCSEDRYINVDRNRILERARKRAHKDRCKQQESYFKDNGLFYESCLINVVVGIGLNRLIIDLRFNCLIWFAFDEHLIWKLIGSFPKADSQPDDRKRSCLMWLDVSWFDPPCLCILVYILADSIRTVSVLLSADTHCLSVSSQGSNPEDFSHLPPEQRRKKLQAKIDDINKDIQKEMDQRYTDKHKRVYPVIRVKSQSIHRNKDSLKKNNMKTLIVSQLILQSIIWYFIHFIRFLHYYCLPITFLLFCFIFMFNVFIYLLFVFIYIFYLFAYICNIYYLHIYLIY